MAKPQNPLSAEFVASFESMNLSQQEAALDCLTNIHNSMKDARREALRAELGALHDWPARKAEKEKPKAKYRSHRNPALTWAGRGQPPTWLVDEMKETGKARDEFLVK